MKHFPLFAFIVASALAARIALAAQTAGFTESTLRAAHHDGRKMDYVV